VRTHEGGRGSTGERGCLSSAPSLDDLTRTTATSRAMKGLYAFEWTVIYAAMVLIASSVARQFRANHAQSINCRIAGHPGHCLSATFRRCTRTTAGLAVVAGLRNVERCSGDPIDNAEFPGRLSGPTAPERMQGFPRPAKVFLWPLCLEAEERWLVEKALVLFGVGEAELWGGKGFEDLQQLEAGMEEGVQDFSQRPAVGGNHDMRAEAFPEGADSLDGKVVLGFVVNGVKGGVADREDEVPAGFEGAVEAAKDAGPVGNIVHDQGGEDEVEGGIGEEGEIGGEIGTEERGAIAGAGAGQFDHFGAGIDGGDVGAAIEQPFGVSAGATAGVENREARDVGEEREGGRALVPGVVRFGVDMGRVCLSQGFVGVEGEGLMGWHDESIAWGDKGASVRHPSIAEPSGEVPPRTVRPSTDHARLRRVRHRFRSGCEEVLSINSGVTQNGSERPVRHVARMVRGRGGTLGRSIGNAFRTK